MQSPVVAATMSTEATVDSIQEVDFLYWRRRFSLPLNTGACLTCLSLTSRGSSAPPSGLFAELHPVWFFIDHMISLYSDGPWLEWSPLACWVLIKSDRISPKRAYLALCLLPPVRKNWCVLGLNVLLKVLPLTWSKLGTLTLSVDVAVSNQLLTSSHLSLLQLRTLPTASLPIYGISSSGNLFDTLFNVWDFFF